MSKTKVIVLMGGESDEREVSLRSGLQVIENIDSEKYEMIPAIVSEKDGRWLITSKEELKQITSGQTEHGAMVVNSEKKVVEPKKVDNLVVFIAMHGKNGEDGRVQGFLDLLRIPYTGSGVLASAIGMDKIMFKKLMKAEGVLVPKSWDDTDSEKIVFPCVVKPATSGSSIGVSIVNNGKELERAMTEAKKFDQKIMIEECIKGTEVSCGVLGNDDPQALPVIEIRPANEFFDYEAKYEGKLQEICPAEISDDLTRRVQEIAVKVFKAIGARGFGRVDMIIRGEEIFVLEINTIPGLTPQSLLPQEAAAAGISYSQLLDKMILLARES